MYARLIPVRTGARAVTRWAATLLLHVAPLQAQLAPPAAGAESGADAPYRAPGTEAEDTLLATIAALDARYFSAYDRCDLAALDDLHTDDLEAYHDLAGGPVGWETVRQGLEQGVCAEPGRIRRELVPGTLEAHPIPGFGALQLADHRFYEVDSNGTERAVTAARVIILWRRLGGGYRVSRVVSYDHKPASSEGPAASSVDTRTPHVEADAAPVPDTVRVAPPTGDRETDRASVVAALEQVQPGGTLQFAPGSYLIGEVISISTPRIAILGHPAGTTLRGCDRAVFEATETRIAGGRPSLADLERCGLLELTGGHATVRGFTFELSHLGLMLGCCHGERRFREAAGGYRVEGNTFRESVNGVRPLLASPEPTVIRGNRFINTFHAVSAAGSHIHVVDNDISAPEPGRVPGIGHPSFALAFASVPSAPGDPTQPPLHSEHNVVTDNRIEGHPEGIVLSAYAGSVRRNVIRGNIVIVRRVPLPSQSRPEIVSMGNDSDSTIVGVPLHLYRPGAAARDAGPPPIIEDNLVEGNELRGADGVAVILDGARRTRIINNTISSVRRRDPFPGNTLTSSPERWRGANGSGVWVSSGSDDNEILGNTFEGIAADAVVLEGDRNRVGLRSVRDSVRDLGRENQVRRSGGTGGS